VENRLRSKRLITAWEPDTGWLLLLPSRLPDRQGDIILPETFTKKQNSGICFAPTQDNPYINKECLFPQHQEYQVIDTETGWLFYVLQIAHVIMTRIPPQHILDASWEKIVDSFQIETFETSSANL
jgi:hypothetical protein